MSATNTTTNLGLSQFVNTDVPAWRQDYNGDMLKIDNAYTADISGATAETSADPSDYMKFYDVSATTNKKILISDLLKGAKVEDLTDTDITTPVDNDGLVYDSTSQKWENVPIMTQEAQNVLGAKNILYHTLTDKVSDGVTYHVNDDRSITATITGTHSSDTNMPITNDWDGFDISAYIGKTLICSGGQGIGSTFGLNFQILDSSRNFIAYMPNEEEYTLPNNAKYCIPILFITSSATSSYTFKPMIRLKGTDSTYVPHAMTNRELTEVCKNKDVAWSFSATSYPTFMQAIIDKAIAGGFTHIGDSYTGVATYQGVDIFDFIVRKFDSTSYHLLAWRTNDMYTATYVPGTGLFLFSYTGTVVS